MSNTRGPSTSGRHYLAENIPGAELVVLPGDSHAWFAECAEQIAQHVERFLTGIWERGEWDAVETDRVLATVLAVAVPISIALWSLDNRAFAANN